jgi:mRNA interferase HigB
VVNLLGKRRVEELQKLHADAADELRSWYIVSKKAKWKSLLDVQQDFKDADQVGKVVIFNIRHNVYRLIARVDYRSKLVMVKDLLTHKEYDKGAWKKWA